MDSKNEQTLRKLVQSIKNADRGKTSAYDTTATVRRIEDGTAWVHIPGGVDETPVKLTIAAAPGDQVQVRVSGGRAFLVGNATSPPTDDTTARAAVKQIGAVSKVVKTVQRIAEQAAKIAGNTNQYFWHNETGTDTGAHITEVPQEEFLADPANGGGNLLARSNGIAVRNGLDELASFSQNGLAVEMPEGAYQSGVGLTFNRAGEQIGRVWSSTLYGKFAVFEGLKHAVLYGLTNADIFAPKVFIAHYDPSSTAIDPEDCDVEISGNLTVSGTIHGTVSSGSDRRIKEDFARLDEYEEVFLELKPRAFRYTKEFAKDDRIRFGFIAQDVQTALKKANKDWEDHAIVSVGEDDRLYIDYSNMQALNTHMIQRLYRRIEALEAHISELEKEKNHEH